VWTNAHKSIGDITEKKAGKSKDVEAQLDIKCRDLNILIIPFASIFRITFGWHGAKTGIISHRLLGNIPKGNHSSHQVFEHISNSRLTA
jgi:hypothetical protein